MGTRISGPPEKLQETKLQEFLKFLFRLDKKRDNRRK